MMEMITNPVALILAILLLIVLIFFLIQIAITWAQVDRHNARIDRFDWEIMK